MIHEQWDVDKSIYYEWMKGHVYGQIAKSKYFEYSNWISKLFNLNGLDEYQQSKTFNYFPVKTII